MKEWKYFIWFHIATLIVAGALAGYSNIATFPKEVGVACGIVSGISITIMVLGYFMKGVQETPERRTWRK